jgi:aromatic ring-opening dioxygenase catalytic subunit (LigB family)
MARVVLTAASSHAPGMAAFSDAGPQDQRDRFFGALSSLRALVVERRVDAIVLVSNEHFTNFFYDNFPPVCIGVGESFFGPVEPWLKIEQGRIPGHADLADHVLRATMADGAEMAFSHRLKLDHGMVTVYRQLSLEGRMPLVPIIQNCAVSPMPSLRRCYDLGVALRRAVESYPADLNVAILGAGGLSHWVGHPRVGDIDDVFDRWFLERLAAGDIDELCSIPDAELELAGNGAHEIRSWLTAAGAAAPDRATILAYENIQPWITGMGVAVFG